MTNNRPTYTTPKVTLGFCSIREPDTKFANEADPNDKGVYKAKLRMPKDAPETKAFIDQIQGVFDQFLVEEKAKKGKTPKVHEDGIPWQDELDRETEEPTGNILVSCKLKARVVTKSGRVFDQRVKVFDAKGKLIPDVPNIGPGSTVRVSGSINCWNPNKAGVTLWLEAIQLIDLVERNGDKDAEGYGFGAEDGYEDDGGGEDTGGFPVDPDAKGDF
ncbi:MAG: hypothetical protein H6590_06155 [Flavobacteriales bacterium]|nr:hypothetical protein [Flavobacteriales bacterium]